MYIPPQAKPPQAGERSFAHDGPRRKPTRMRRPLLTLAALALIAQATAQPRPRPRRADSFFGVHFDLHATEDITDAGATLTPAMLDSFLRRVRPDFVQIDCKGHPGISSYPTRAGHPLKGFTQDPLRLWRDATARQGVGLYLHYSGVWDGKAATTRPDWAVVKASGERSREKVSFFSPYLDSLMIPQLRELSADYRVDGAWIDGECWAVEPDYGEAALEAWRTRSGGQEAPRRRDDRLFPDYLDFTRDLFRRHLARYVDAIHAFDPGFQVTSNWSYSSLMPEPVTTGVDYLSGDVTPQNGVYRSAFEARCLAPQGKPWDLMAWGFSWNGDKMPMGNKSAIQLKQEAAQVMAMGGGIQFYYQQNRDLSLKPWLAETLAELAAFCRARQPFCHQATAVPQVALLFPALSYRRAASNAFGGAPGKLPATLYALLDAQYPVEVLMEHHLAGNLSKYPLLVVPECDTLAEPLLAEIRTYLREGGRILVIGPDAARLFAAELGIHTSTGIPEKAAFIEAAGHLGAIRSPILEAQFASDVRRISPFYGGSDFRDVLPSAAATIRQVGRGRIAGIYFNAGSGYAQFKTPVIRDLVDATIRQLSPDRKVTVTGSHLVHVTLNRRQGKTFLNLVNVAGEHTNPNAIGYDQVPALTDLAVQWKGRPSRMVLQPGGRPLPMTREGEWTTVRIPRLDLHAVIDITE